MATPSGFALHVQSSAEEGDESPGDRQAEANPLRPGPSCLCGTEERLTDQREFVRRDPAPLVRHDQNRFRPARLHGHDDRAARRTVLAGVVEQVVEYLTEQRRVRPDGGGPISRLDREIGGTGVVGPLGEPRPTPPGKVNRFGVGEVAIGLGTGEE